MNNFKSPINFMLDEVYSYGIKNDKFSNKYCLSIIVDQETKNKIQELVVKYGTKDPFYRDILYLKISTLSKKQREELLDEGRCIVKINFDAIGVYKTKDEKKYLMFKVKGLRRLKDEVPTNLNEDAKGLGRLKENYHRKKM